MRPVSGRKFRPVHLPSTSLPRERSHSVRPTSLSFVQGSGRSPFGCSHTDIKRSHLLNSYSAARISSSVLRLCTRLHLPTLMYMYGPTYCNSVGLFSSCLGSAWMDVIWNGYDQFTPRLVLADHVSGTRFEAAKGTIQFGSNTGETDQRVPPSRKPVSS